MPKHTVPVADKATMGHILQWGFHQARQVPGEQARAIYQTACIELPPRDPENAGVMLRLFSGRETWVRVKAGEASTELTIKAGNWDWYAVDVPADETRVVLETDFGKLYGWSDMETVHFGGVAFHSTVEELPGRIENKPVVVSWTNSAFESCRGIDFGDPHFKQVDPADEDGWAKVADYGVYFGDLHIHTNLSRCCYPFNKTIEQNYRIARDEWDLDFACTTDHEYLADEQWAESVRLANKWNDPGRFATIIGNEWTSLDYGHKNIYWRGDDAPCVSRYDRRTDTPDRLYAFLKDRGEPCIVVPHHPSSALHLTNWNYHDPELTTLVESVSNWGNSECYGALLQNTEETVPGCYVQDALALGYKLGFIGSSDGHVFCGGDSPIAAVYAPELTREALFDGLRARRTYATSGAKIKLNFQINHYFMGSIIKVNQYNIDSLFPLKLMVAAEGTAAIDRVEVIANGNVIYTNHKHTGRFTRVAFPLTIDNPGSNLAQSNRYYYVRVIQHDGHVAWSSPIWIDFDMNDRQEL